MPDTGERTRPSNVVLVGMPGVGKSTVGVLLAKAAGLGFLDTDVWIQQRETRTLPQLLEAGGRQGFLALEERHLLGLALRAHVIATGGSVVYSEAAMAHLRRDGVVVHLDLPLPELERRVADLEVRGVVIEPGRTLADLHAERGALYRRHADVRIPLSGLAPDRAVAQLFERLAAWGIGGPGSCA